MGSGVLKAAKSKPAVATENRIQKFVRETRAELRKVVWPTREQTRNLTVIVMLVSAAVGTFLGVVDFIFKRIFELIIGGF